MSFLSDGDLASMRADLNQSLPGTAVIQTLAGTSDGGGGGSVSWTASGTVACRLSPIQRMGHETEVGDRLTPESHWTATLPALTAVGEDDRLVINGSVFNVVRVKAPMDYELSCRVEVLKEF